MRDLSADAGRDDLPGALALGQTAEENTLSAQFMRLSSLKMGK
jgi:hypothetical protein